MKDFFSKFIVVSLLSLNCEKNEENIDRQGKERNSEKEKKHVQN